MHSLSHADRLTTHLQAILGEDGYVQFTQALGGTRVYIAHKMRGDNDVVQAVGRAAADKLSRALAPATIRVPLARRERALFYRKQGLTNAAIALKLGMTQTSIGKLFAREPNLPERPGSAKKAAQLSLF